MASLLHSFWREPRAPGARPPRRGDWVLTGVVVVLAVTEAILDETLTWPVFSAAVTIVLAGTLPWRRVAPLRAVTLAFGATGLAHGAGIITGTPWQGLDTNAVLLVLPYALLRWGSGREAVLGLGVMAASFATAMWAEGHGWGEVLGASLFLLFPAALGASIRYQDSAARRALEQVRLREREQLARELHDSVAHHVSAIAVQAQAGRALARTEPDAAEEVLGVIEEAASRTLTDMRRIVGALRSEGDASLAPAAGLAELRGLAAGAPGEVPVTVLIDAALTDLDASLQSTLYRLAQEAVTNARRHARDATRVDVRVQGQADAIRLSVDDDGTPSAQDTGEGFGLRGMRERAMLLGGTFQAGPGARGGWSVEAVLPRRVAGT